MLKAPFVLEIFTFFSWPPDYEEKQLNKKFKVDFKVYDVTDWTTNIYNHVFSNISRSKGNQTRKFGLLVKY